MRFNLTKSLDETKLATRLLLDLAADILWSRQQHAALPGDRRHAQ